MRDDDKRWIPIYKIAFIFGICTGVLLGWKGPKSK